MSLLYLIDANRDYYPIERILEFWQWLLERGKQGRIKIPQEFYEEAPENQVSLVTEQGYADDLTDEDIEKIGRDPFLVANALVDVQNRSVVTTERSSPRRRRANRKLPDVCNDFNVRCINTFTLIQELDFRTGWRANDL